MFTTLNLDGGGYIQIGETMADGSFVREEGASPSVKASFTIRGASDASTAYIALISWLRSNYADGGGGIAAYDLPLDVVRIQSTAAPSIYTAECDFKFRDEGSGSGKESDGSINEPSFTLPDIEDSDYTFETTGGAAHITHGLAWLGGARADGEEPVDFGGVIGPHDDGSADGVDIVTPSMAFSIGVSLPKSWFSTAYRSVIANATGAINAATWNGLAPGCALFRGVSARVVWISWTNPAGLTMRDWYWRATYSFAASPSVTLNVGGKTLLKRGFDAVSRVSERYADEYGNTINAVAQVDVFAVYPSFDFALLKLPLPA